jgi:uncharacterized membrane protein
MAKTKSEKGRRDGYEIQGTPNAFRPGIDRKRRFFLRAVWFCTMILIGGSFLLFAPRVQRLSLAAQVTEVTYPVKTFQNGKARFYEYKAGDGITIKYFILKSSDGVVRAAFDACDVCWREGKGYYQKDDFMICRNCGRRFASVNVNVITGGCNPGALKREVMGEKLVIKVKDILEGKKYFNFSKRG